MNGAGPARLAVMMAVWGAALAQPPHAAECHSGEVGGPASRATVHGLVARARQVMGSPLEILTLVADGQPAADAVRALDAALDEVERLDKTLSNWRQDSELSALNRAAAAGPVVCSAELFEILSAAVAAAVSTGGAFDPTVEPWVVALGLRAESDSQGRPPLPLDPPPAGGDLPSLPPRGGSVRLEPGTRRVSFTSADVGVDLGGIGKGYALDRAAAVLRAQGIGSALLNFGGQALALGAPPGEKGWIVEVADPLDRQRPALALTLSDASVATSANTERGVRRGGQWIGHVLDPETGRPAPFPGSATAVAPDATRADAYATALLVMGPERGLTWAEGRDDVAAAYLTPSAGGQVHVRATSSFERYREAERSSKPERAAR